MNIPEGWPTEDMITAGNRAYWWEHDGAASDVESYDRKMRRAFLAMLAAAPTPPAQEVETVASILRDICESEPDNPDNPNTVCINVDALQLILERHIPQDGKLRKAAEELMRARDYGSIRDQRIAIDNLRAALEVK